MADQEHKLAEIARKKRYLHLIQKLHGGKALTKPEIVELEEFEAGPLAPTVVKTIEEVAREMHVSYRTVQRWKRDDMPITREGFYDLEEIKSWHEMKNQLNGKTDSEREQYITEWYKNRAQLSDIAVRKAKGELISRKEIETIFRNKIIAFARTFVALPREAAPAMEGMDIRQRETYLTERINEIRSQFAEPILKNEEDEGDGESQEERQDGLEPGREGNFEASTKDNSQPVE